MTNALKKQLNRTRRHNRIRAVISGTADRPRVVVFRSNQHVYAQAIDDVRGATLAGASDLKLKIKESKEMTTKVGAAHAVGQALAEQLKAAGVSKAVFDRGGFKFHGRVKAVAEGLRHSGIHI